MSSTDSPAGTDAEFHPRVAVNGNCFQGESLEHDLGFCERHSIPHLTVPVVKFEQDRERGIDAMQGSPVKTSMSSDATPPSSSARTAALTSSSRSNRHVTRLASANR